MKLEIQIRNCSNSFIFSSLFALSIPCSYAGWGLIFYVVTPGLMLPRENCNHLQRVCVNLIVQFSRWQPHFLMQLFVFFSLFGAYTCGLLGCGLQTFSNSGLCSVTLS